MQTFTLTQEYRWGEYPNSQAVNWWITEKPKLFITLPSNMEHMDDPGALMGYYELSEFDSVWWTGIPDGQTGALEGKTEITFLEVAEYSANRATLPSGMYVIYWASSDRLRLYEKYPNGGHGNDLTYLHSGYGTDLKVMPSIREPFIPDWHIPNGPELLVDIDRLRIGLPSNIPGITPAGTTYGMYTFRGGVAWDMLHRLARMRAALENPESTIYLYKIGEAQDGVSEGVWREKRTRDFYKSVPDHGIAVIIGDSDYWDPDSLAFSLYEMDAIAREGSGLGFIALDEPSAAWTCPGEGDPAVWVGGGTPTTPAPDCTGVWECPGNGADPVWSNPSVDPYGDVPYCRGFYYCPGNGADPAWSHPGVDPYGTAPDCTGSYTCPGNGDPAVWEGTVAPYGTVPDCTGTWECLGNDADPTWNNPNVDPYGDVPSCAGSYVCPGDGDPAIWNNPNVAPYGEIPDCTGVWECPGEGDPSIWSNPNVVPYGVAPDCAGAYVCPGNGDPAIWNNPNITPYGTVPDCTGIWECPGDGDPAVWSNLDITPYGTVPDCVGAWECPGSGVSAVWNNPDITPYGIVPDCNGEWECPGNGDPAVWVGNTDPYGTPPLCTGSYSCPGEGAAAVWSNPEVMPYGEIPDCTGRWDCGGSMDLIWTNPAVDPYPEESILSTTFGSVFLENTGGANKQEFLVASPGSETGIVGVRGSTKTINHECGFIVASRFDEPQYVSGSLVEVASGDVVVDELVLERSDNSTDGEDGTWVSVGSSIVPAAGRGDNVVYLPNETPGVNSAVGWRIRIPAIGVDDQSLDLYDLTINSLVFTATEEIAFTRFVSSSPDNSHSNGGITTAFYTHQNHLFGVARDTGGILGVVYDTAVSLASIVFDFKVHTTPPTGRQLDVRQVLIESSTDTTNGYNGNWRMVRAIQVLVNQADTTHQITMIV